MRRWAVSVVLVVALTGVAGCGDLAVESEPAGPTTVEMGPYGLHPDFKDDVEDCMDFTVQFLNWLTGTVRVANAVDSAVSKGFVWVSAQTELAGDQFDLFSLVVTCEQVFPKVWSGTIDKISTEIDTCALMALGPPVTASEIEEANKVIAACSASGRQVSSARDAILEKFDSIRDWLD